ncbi:MAG: HEPN domain-containing protein [Bacteroidota bacterium]
MKIKKEKIKLIEEWFSIARENLLFAKSGIDEEYSPYPTICFLCQGSAEKYLKAFLIRNGWELEKTHDLVDLLVSCIDYNPKFDILKEECHLLNEYITEGRYPGDLPFENINKDDAIKAIEAAEKIEDKVLKNINLPPI